MFLKRTMRYYRVWIYCCNVTLLLSTIVFVILLIWFLSDIHMSLLPSVSLIHPSFIYAFFALALQGGMVQVKILSSLLSYFLLTFFFLFFFLSFSSLCLFLFIFFSSFHIFPSPPPPATCSVLLLISTCMSSHCSIFTCHRFARDSR